MENQNYRTNRWENPPCERHLRNRLHQCGNIHAPRWTSTSQAPLCTHPTIQELPTSTKISVCPSYAASVCSTLTHGSEAWMLTPRALATLNGFNSRQLHRITGRSYRDEATKPSYDLLTAVRTRRHHWLGHILRMPADRLVRRAVLALGQRAGPPYQPGSLLMDTPLPLNELIQRAADRRGWARDGRSLSSLQESP